MDKYRYMEVRGTLPQVGFWEENFNRIEFQKSEMGKYVNTVVVYSPVWGFIDIYFFGKQEIPALISYINSMTDVEFSLFHGCQFENGVMIWSCRNHSLEDARNVFRALYRNSVPE